jgi:hypothetical protein
MSIKAAKSTEAVFARGLQHLRFLWLNFVSIRGGRGEWDRRRPREGRASVQR